MSLTSKQDVAFKCIKCKDGDMIAVDKPAIGQIVDVVDLVLHPDSMHFQFYESRQCRHTYYKAEGVK